MSMISAIKSKLPPRLRLRLYYAKLRLNAKVFHRSDLSHLALFYHTDKWGRHWYTQHYQRYFQPFKRKRLNRTPPGKSILSLEFSR